MRKERAQYDDRNLKNAVKLSYERKNVSELARDLDISSNLIYCWRKETKEYRDGSFPSNGIQKMTPEEKIEYVKKRKLLG